MHRKTVRSISVTVTSILCLLIIQQAAFAGPPLLCHPFDIGNARSLPWAGSNQWRAVDQNYVVNRLVADTLDLLTADTPVLVRMETLRRAAVYAAWPASDGRVAKDGSVASELLLRLKARIPDPGERPEKRASALAMFDFGYLVETYKQGYYDPQAGRAAKLVSGVDGYALIVKAIAQIGSSPEMEYAAALSCMGKKREAGQNCYVAHLQKAADGAQEGSLLARNMLNYLRDRGKTIAELRANIATAKN